MVSKKRRKDDMTLKDVDGFWDAVLFFLKEILIKHFVKICVFALMTYFFISGFECNSKWGAFKKDPIISPTSQEEVLP